MLDLTLVRSGYSDNGASMWHIFDEKTGQHYITKCGTSMPWMDSTLLDAKRYNGGRRISMCSYCLKEV